MRSHRLAPPPPLPELIDDAIAEILLRLPLPGLQAVAPYPVRAHVPSPLPRVPSNASPPRLPMCVARTPADTTSQQAASSHDNDTHPLPPACVRMPGSRLPPWPCPPQHGGWHGHDQGKSRSVGPIWAVLCAVAGCNHRAGYHEGDPFQVVFVSTSYNYNDGTSAARAWVYILLRDCCMERTVFCADTIWRLETPGREETSGHCWRPNLLLALPRCRNSQV